MHINIFTRCNGSVKGSCLYSSRIRRLSVFSDQETNTTTKRIPDSRRHASHSNSNAFLTPSSILTSCSSSKSSSLAFFSVRCFGRKAGKMGKHLQNLEEMAHLNSQATSKKKSTSVTDPLPNHHPSFMDSSLGVSERNDEHKHDEHEEDEEESDMHHTLPSAVQVKERMMKAVLATQTSLKAIRGSEPSPELFDSVQVQVYGSSSPLSSVAQVVITSPTLVTLSCFDPQTAPQVRDAIRDNMPGMNFQPTLQDGAVLVPIPRVSAETRKAIVKQLGKLAEDTKQRIRRIRRAAMEVVKKAKDGKMEGVSEDDAYRCGKDIDVVTEECIQSLNDVVLKKQKDVMSV